MDFTQYISKFSALLNTSGWEDGGFVSVYISSCYQNLAVLMLILTFLSTLLKYMVVAALCTNVLGINNAHRTQPCLDSSQGRSTSNALGVPVE